MLHAPCFLAREVENYTFSTDTDNFNECLVISAWNFCRLLMCEKHAWNM